MFEFEFAGDSFPCFGFRFGQQLAIMLGKLGVKQFGYVGELRVCRQ